MPQRRAVSSRKLLRASRRGCVTCHAASDLRAGPIASQLPDGAACTLCARLVLCTMLQKTGCALARPLFHAKAL